MGLSLGPLFLMRAKPASKRRGSERDLVLATVGPRLGLALSRRDLVPYLVDRSPRRPRERRVPHPEGHRAERLVVAPLGDAQHDVELVSDHQIEDRVLIV